MVKSDETLRANFVVPTGQSVIRSVKQLIPTLIRMCKLI